MTAPPAPQQLYAWAWLSGATDPVVAGVLTRTENIFDKQPVVTFTYARSYRERAGAMSLFTPELPLHAGTFDPTRPGETSTATLGMRIAPAQRPRAALALHGCLRDAAPDAWDDE